MVHRMILRGESNGVGWISEFVSRDFKLKFFKIKEARSIYKQGFLILVKEYLILES